MSDTVPKFMSSQVQAYCCFPDTTHLCKKKCIGHLIYTATLSQQKTNLHLNDYFTINKNETMFEVRPHIDFSNKKFQQFGVHKTNLSVDNPLALYCGRNPRFHFQDQYQLDLLGMRCVQMIQGLYYNILTQAYPVTKSNK